MRKNINKLATLVMTGALAASMSFGAFAEETTFAGKTVNLTKTVTTDPANKTSAPYTTFKLNVTAGENASNKAIVTKDADGKEIKDAPTFEVYAGVGLSDIVVTDADFTDGQYTTLADNKGYKDNFTIKVPNSIFTAPGVYAYKLQEVQGSYTGIVYDTTVYDMYVFVENEIGSDNKPTGKFVVSGIVVSKPDGTKIGGGSDASFTDPEGIVNNFGKEDPENPNTNTTHDITISKTVAGNTANFSKTFNFYVSVAPKPKDGVTAPAEQKFTLTYADGTTQPLEFAADGQTHQVAIQNGQVAKINGLTDDYEVSVYEDEAGADGYTTTYLTSNVNESTADTLKGKLAAKTDVVKLNVTADEATLGITNTRENTIPTGVAMDIAPYALMVALAGGAAATFLRKKESFED